MGMRDLHRVIEFVSNADLAHAHIYGHKPNGERGQRLWLTHFGYRLDQTDFLIGTT